MEDTCTCSVCGRVMLGVQTAEVLYGGHMCVGELCGVYRLLRCDMEGTFKCTCRMCLIKSFESQTHP